MSTPTPPIGSAAFWNQRYHDAGDTFVFGTAPNTFLASCAPALRPGSVLCLGEGEGRNAVHLAGLGHTVTAVDQSATGLAKAQDLASRHGLSLQTVEADLGDYPIESASRDTVVSIFCHLPPELRRAVHARAAAGLRPGGAIILEAYTPAQTEHCTGGPVGDTSKLMRLEEVAQEFPGVTWQIAHEIEREVVEGSAHTGHAAVLQLFGHRDPIKA